MVLHVDISDAILRKSIRHGMICLGGNRKLRIYGRLGCKSGKKLKRINRVFFGSEEDALSCGFRPCGHCMKAEYTKWKNEPV